MADRTPTFMQKVGWRIEAIFYDLFVAITRALPVDTASDLGGWLFRHIGPLTSTQKTVLRNFELAFPNMPTAERDALIRQQWENTGRTTAEFPIMDRIVFDPARVEIENFERLETIAQSGKPVIFISGHLSNWEVMNAAILQAKVPYMITYRAANNPYVDARIKSGRAAYGVNMFAPKGGDGAKELLIALQKGESVGLMNDQKFNRGVPTPFFGHIAETAPGPTKLAQRFGTVLQPLTIRRLHKARFRVTVHDAIPVDDTGHKGQDVDSTVCKVTAFIEHAVRDNPAEWFWVHKRWPTSLYKSAPQ
ncbi:lysophospholipid acyltransferase family protein [Asticcacaulis sp. 201]|uniref:lysophospholipid acyltransferase family protein n=1 Tax=Asticcacaulis sp. 201 TaxID=3028787 RepID=UPI0029170DC7|nr:lysophospholipid acyltransferase family protein [Asticcacaulis sp. 201]MDV6329392.1 lysophospholipid acyltransferase family protein [Asticcacaulis sp. 201]